MEVIRILALAVVASTLYGVAHDFVTAQVCAEYFAIGHPPLHDAAAQALLVRTGMSSVWFLGAAFAIPLALLARAGDDRPKLGIAEVAPAIFAVVAKVALVALISGVAGYTLADGGKEALVGPLATRVPAEQHAAFIGAYWAHRGACVAGLVGTGLVCAWAWARRGRLGALR